jgi:hypothetical protein
MQKIGYSDILLDRDCFYCKHSIVEVKITATAQVFKSVSISFSDVIKSARVRRCKIEETILAAAQGLLNCAVCHDEGCIRANRR